MVELTTSQKTAKMYSKFNTDNNGESNECYTRLVEARKLVKFLEKYNLRDKIVWCPFDKENSNIVIALKERGYKVIYTHIEYGQDFLNYVPNFAWDVMISNPPFSKRTKFFNKIESYKIPYIMLQPLMFFNNNSMINMLINGSNKFRLLLPKNRMGFITKMREYEKSTRFYSFWLCKDLFLDRDMFIELKEYSEEK